VNLKAGLPRVEEALGRLRSALQEARMRGDRVLKLIHGYGSSGKGGRIRDAVRRYLAGSRRRGAIADYVPGEEVRPGSEGQRVLRKQLSERGREDPDLERGNPGVTFVVLP
jgi:DNA-nicking Smr family endonuclease